jgi:phage terminase large subunit GpA-like protein
MQNVEATLNPKVRDQNARQPDAWDLALARARRRGLRPPERLTLSQWAKEYGRLPHGSAQTGRFHAYAYQNGIMDAITDPTVETVTVMKGARVGYTRVLDMAIGYYLHQDPSPILVVQPRVEDAESFSKIEITPMLRETPVLAEIAGPLKAKDGSQTILQKSFANGSSLILVGANSPAGFRRITVKVVLLDECDGYPPSGAGDEGDQVELATKRSETYWNRKIVLGSTPGLRGLSRIEQSFGNSDQRRYFVPCPHCGEKQVLEWGGKDMPHGIKWRKTEAGAHLPETAYYVCRTNGCIIEEIDKPEMIAAGEWRATSPFRGHAGFRISALYSPHHMATWDKIARRWLDSKGNPERRKVFINTVLGESYEDRGDRALNEVNLLRRREIWPGEVPPRVGVLTAGLDVQGDRIEIEVVGWGADEESWSLAHEVFEGDASEPMVWEAVDAYLKKKWWRADGREFEIMAACIDSGYATQAVYTFSKARLGRRIWAVKGESARGGARSPVWPVKRPTARTKASFRPVIIGVNAAKDSIRQRLHIETPGPGYMHFKTDRDVNYFAQLVSERLVTKQSGGQRFPVWELTPGRRNEAVDMRCYAYAALCGLQHFGLQLNRRAEAIAATYDGPVLPVLKPAAENAPTPSIGPPVQGPVYDPPPGAVITTAGRPRNRFRGRMAGA